MQSQRQAHQLSPTWEAEDYASQSQASAQASARYYQLISQKVSVVDADLDQLNLKLDRLERENVRLSKNIEGMRNTSLIWGVGGAIVASLVMSLILVPSLPSQPVRQSAIGLGG